MKLLPVYKENWCKRHLSILATYTSGYLCNGWPDFLVTCGPGDVWTKETKEKSAQGNCPINLWTCEFELQVIRLLGYLLTRLPVRWVPVYWEVYAVVYRLFWALHFWITVCWVNVETARDTSSNCCCITCTKRCIYIFSIHKAERK